MNSTFEKYEFPQSGPKKVLIPLVSGKDNQSETSFQLKLDLPNNKTDTPKST